MRSRRPDGATRDEPGNVISRRRLLAVGGVVTAGTLAGCLNRVASAVTNTGAAPAAAFAGVDWNDDETEVTIPAALSQGDPHVSRLTPTLSGESRGLSGEVELEGWVTSSAVVAANYNNTRSNRSTIASPDSSVTDEELERILRYLEGEAVVGERFAVCLPDAEVPGGNGSLVTAVTPQRLIDYVTGRSDGAGRVYSWGDADADGDGLGDCDDSEGSGEPDAVCGATEHLVAAVSRPTPTGGGLVAARDAGGTVTVLNTPPTAERGPAVLVCPADGEAYEPAGLTEWGRAADGPPAVLTQQGRILDVLVAQVMVQPPGCPHAFPALFYASRGVSDDQLVYSGGWVIDDAALYSDSVTALTMEEAAQVVGVDLGDLDSDGDGFGDAVERSLSGERARRGARLDSGSVDALVESGVMSEGGKETVDHYVRKKPGRSAESGGGLGVTHLAIDAPVLHLVNAGGASNEVKFKAGAALSKRVN